MASPAEEPLPIDVVARCTRLAQRDGIFAGTTAGLVGGILGARLFRFNRNTAFFSGAVTGVLVGYQLTQTFLATNIAHAKFELAKEKAAKAEEAAATQEDPDSM